ncbi:MEDS domain-containing protein [Methanosarcina sp.]|uniref:MEDS domain-containing protein n=1 Tax=Methanosarcina sp. TaxID=2213 RepID=UPI002ABBCD27|nr:MEDS domain-containing protein [Methanosarcina sp.]MDY9927489.1 MEDS domain-containing protein [Methanosarcina sp.]
MEENVRNSGIDVIGDVPWGTHFCQFYQTKEDLMDIIVPYFKAGLENNELCVWITSQPSEVEEVKEALRRAVPDFDVYLERGQMEIIPYTHGYLKEGVFNPEKVVNNWIEKINQALTRGYDGLRATGDNRWLEKEGWDGFVNYEKKVDAIIDKHHVIALCPYYLDMCSTAEIIDVVSNHQFALIKREGKWERIENSGRKRAEEAAVQAAKDWEQTFDAVPDLISVIDNEYRIVRANRAMAAKMGTIPEECMGLTCYHAVHGTTEPPSFCPQRRLLEDGLEHKVEVHENLLGDSFLISVSPLYDNEGKVIRSVHVARDITESKKAEEALKKAHDNLEERVKERTAELEEAYKALMENERRLSEAQKMAHIGNWEWNIVTNKPYWSEEMYRIFGLDLQEFGLPYDEVLSYIHPDDRDYADNAVRRALNGEPYDIDYRIIRADGEERVVHLQGEVIFDEKKTPISIRGTLQDITERKKAEKALELSRERYRSFIQNFKGIAFQADRDFNLEYMKGNVEEITGYSEEEFISEKLWRKLIEPEDLPLFLKKERETKSSPSACDGQLDYRIKCRDGEIKWVHEIYQKIPGKNGKPMIYQGAIYDITERKETEEVLAKAEDARKKEIHHRIKNNLQVISSLLDLQVEKFSEKEAIQAKEILEAFRESQNRVISMSLIHEELYKGKETDTLDFSAYLQKLVKNLFQTYSLGRENVCLCMDLEENAFFNMDTAVPLGIIVNELVSNSLKHAFTEGEGEIQIKLCREHKGDEVDRPCFTMTVSDNGKGISENIELESLETLGLQLVSILVDQLDGNIELKREQGTEFKISFDIV